MSKRECTDAIVCYRIFNSSKIEIVWEDLHDALGDLKWQWVGLSIDDVEMILGFLHL